MEILLDTHVAVWWATDPESLAMSTSTVVADATNTIWFSASSAWELAIKVRTGKLELDVRRFVDQLARNGIRILGIGLDDAIAAGELDWSHRDPFDRMLVAQAQRLGFGFATRDEKIALFLGTRAIAA